MDSMKAYHYTFLGEDYTLGFFFDRYTFNGNLYVGLVNLGNDEDPYFADLTINIMLLLPYVATIDDHLDSNICKWLESIGAGRTYDYKIPCNYGEYPVFQFAPEFLREANPESFAKLTNKTT